jgi:hypothetical protein
VHNIYNLDEAAYDLSVKFIVLWQLLLRVEDSHSAKSARVICELEEQGCLTCWMCEARPRGMGIVVTDGDDSLVTLQSLTYNHHSSPSALQISYLINNTVLHKP